MNSILEIENTIGEDVSESRRPEISEGRAKLTGLVCIGCAAAAVMFAFLGVMFASLGSILFSGLSDLAIKLYVVFFLVSAAFGVFGYSEIKAVRSGLTNSIFQFDTRLNVPFTFIHSRKTADSRRTADSIFLYLFRNL